MKTIFGEVFSKISNGIFIGCLGAILICWGLYETSDTMMLVGIAILCIGFMLATINENRVIAKSKKKDDENKRLKRRLRNSQELIKELQDAVMYLSQDMEQVSNELKSKNNTIERYKKIKLSMLKSSKMLEDEEL